MLQRALFISRYFPDDLGLAAHGIFLRMKMLLVALAAEAEELDLLFFVPRDQLLKQEDLRRFQGELYARWRIHAKVTLCPHSHQGELTRLKHYASFIDARHQSTFARYSGDNCISALERCLRREPDLILAYGLHSMLPLLSSGRTLPPVVLDLNDIEHVKALREVHPRSRKALSSLLRIPAILRTERRALRFAHLALVCSEADRRYLSRWLRLSNLGVIPNAVPFPQARERGATSLTIGYVGYFPYRPNKKAAEELITRIWPMIRARLPQATLLLAGADPEEIPSFKRAQAQDADYAGVEFAGFVPDLNQFYDRVQLVCCPIRAGGGTRIKIVEAAAHGLPVVATRIAAEGLDFVNGAEIILEDNPDKIAEACVALLLDPARCREIGAAARAKAATRYELSSVIASLQEVLRSVSGAHRGRAQGSSSHAAGFSPATSVSSSSQSENM